MYIIVVICHPRRNIAWIHWVFRDRRDWTEAAEKIIKEFYEYYQNKSLDYINIDDGPAVTFASWSNLMKLWFNLQEYRLIMISMTIYHCRQLQ